MSWTTWAVVAAGSLGALARYALGGVVQRRTSGTYPSGTMVVNLLGAAALGLLVGLGDSGRIDAAWRVVLGVGFLGGFTTFSTWAVESEGLFAEGGGAGLRRAAVNLAAQVVVGVAAFTVGAAVGAG